MATKSVDPGPRRVEATNVIAFPEQDRGYFAELRAEHPDWSIEKVARVAMLCQIVEQRMEAGTFRKWGEHSGEAT
jgi:hypothetical protein